MTAIIQTKLKVLIIFFTILFCSYSNALNIQPFFGLPKVLEEAGWLRTPIGLAHPSCVHILESGTQIFDEEGTTKIQVGSGEKIELPKCDFPVVFPADGRPTPQAGFAPGWQVWTTARSTSNSFDGFYGLFTVPNEPKTYVGQTLFMFTGLQNEDWVPGPNSPPAPSDFEIIQPVLQYGPSAGGGGKYWSLASWYVTVNAGFLVSRLIKVYDGDTINGTMQRLSDEVYLINSTNTRTNQNTTLIANKSRLKTNPWAYCTLEVYGDVNNCDTYPSNPQFFTNLELYEGNVKITPSWQVHTTPSPICGEYITVENNNHITIHFTSKQ
eukprot:TRINITY_DN692_c1_g1_i1.p1 TRINITY_DN692_c1_g1~~TRINITY_DN692_c1_g1_i1.p1  ORF type:complete len:343 (+),score=167.65 TRINITY_DN692_c1_g1_i1:57-1031(+)